MMRIRHNEVVAATAAAAAATHQSLEMLFSFLTFSLIDLVLGADSVPAQTPANIWIFLMTARELGFFCLSVLHNNVHGLLSHELVLAPSTADNFYTNRLGRVVILVAHELCSGRMLLGTRL